MEEKRFTVMEVLEMTIGILEGIKIEVKQAEEIGKPIMSAANNLRACMQAMMEDKMKQEAMAEAPEQTEETEEQEDE